MHVRRDGTYGAECMVVIIQVELMWQKFGAGIWEALAKKYPEIDMNDYAPARNYSEPAPKVASGGNPFAATAASSSSSTYGSPAVLSPTASSSTPLTTADVSAASFRGVSEADQIAAIRRLYAVVNPDKMSQVRCAV